MSAAAPPAAPARPDDAVRLDRGELRSVAADARASEGDRLLALTAVLGQDLFRTFWRKAWFALAFLPSFGVIVWILLRSRVEQLRLPEAELAGFALDQLSLTLRAGGVWAAAGAALFGAALLPRDLHAGALLLYFTRPLRRTDYLLARFFGLALWLTAGIALPTLLVCAAAALELGWPPPARTGWQAWLFWPGAAAAATLSAALAGAALAAVALGAGALLRSGSAAAVALIGLGLGSSVVANLMVLLWQRESLAGALDLLRGLGAAWTLLARPLSSEAPVAIATLEAAASLAVWAALALLGWRLAARLLDRAPLGRGRT